MTEKKRAPVHVRDAKHLGSSQRKVLEVIEDSHTGMTFAEIFEEINLIPMTMGTMLDVYADMHLALSGKKDFLPKEKIFFSIRELLDDVEGHLLQENANMKFENNSLLHEQINNIKADFRQFDTFGKLEYIKIIRNKLLTCEKKLENVDDPREVHARLLAPVTMATNIAESVKSYRQQLRNLRAVGAGDSEDAEQRRALARSLRAVLSRTISSLIAREFIVEMVYPDEVYWRDAPSLYVITKKGYGNLREVKNVRGRLLSNSLTSWLDINF